YKAVTVGADGNVKPSDADAYCGLITNPSTPDLDTGWANWFAEYPHPSNFFEPQFFSENVGGGNFAHLDDPQIDAKIAKLAKEQLGPEQEAEYAALDREVMELAPYAPYGTNTVSTFVSKDIDLDGVIFNPIFGQDLTSFQRK